MPQSRQIRGLQSMLGPFGHGQVLIEATPLTYLEHKKARQSHAASNRVLYSLPEAVAGVRLRPQRSRHRVSE